jgi:hypothetical protein
MNFFFFLIHTDVEAMESMLSVNSQMEYVLTPIISSARTNGRHEIMFENDHKLSFYLKWRNGPLHEAANVTLVDEGTV